MLAFLFVENAVLVVGKWVYQILRAVSIESINSAYFLGPSALNSDFRNAQPWPGAESQLFPFLG